MIDKLLPIAAITASFYAVRRFYKWQVSVSLRNESNDTNDYNRICDDVHSLERIATELNAIGEIITDLQTCSSDELRAVRIVIPSALKSDEVTILTDGEDYSAEQLLNLAYSEQQRKREQLLQAISDLYSLTSVPSDSALAYNANKQQRTCNE